MATLLQRKIYRIRNRKLKRPNPIFSRKEYNKYDWMLLNILFLNENLLSSNRIKQIKNNKFPNVLNYLNNRFKDSISLNETLFRIKDKIFNRPICKECGNPVKYRGNGIYSEFCCPKCANSNNEKQEKTKETLIRIYGQPYTFQSEIIKEKSRKTCLAKYKNTSFVNSDNCRQIIKEKYGVEYAFQSPEIIKKCKQSIFDKYHVENYAKTKECQDKIKNTCMEKYGVSSWSKTTEFKKFMKDHKEEINDKRIKTKIKNGTLNTSYEEQKLFNLLKTYYPDVISQYKSEEYPFYCDFYIPSENLYIEYQGYPTHGGKPFENTIDDNIKLNEWVSKNYDGWIFDWTKRDVMKRNCAKSHKLRWIEFFHYDEKLFINEIEKYLDNKKIGIATIL